MTVTDTAVLIAISSRRTRRCLDAQSLAKLTRSSQTSFAETEHGALIYLVFISAKVTHLRSAKFSTNSTKEMSVP